jgi:hypothetical protein
VAFVGVFVRQPFDVSDLEFNCRLGFDDPDLFEALQPFQQGGPHPIACPFSRFPSRISVLVSANDPHSKRSVIFEARPLQPASAAYLNVRRLAESRVRHQGIS